MRWFRIMLLPIAVAMLAGGCGRRQAAETDPETLLAQGWDRMRLGQYDVAQSLFEQAVATTAGRHDDPAARARFSLASVWDLRRPGEDMPRAAGLYRELIAAHPTNTWSGWAQLALARQLETVAIEGPAPLADLTAAYTRVSEAFPGHPAATEAYLHLQAARLAASEAGIIDTAVKELERFVADTPSGPYVSKAWDLLASGYRVQNRGDERLQALIRAAETVEGDIRELRDPTLIWWNIATAAQFDAGNFEVARRYYRKIIEEYPTEQRVFFARQLMAEMDALEEKLRREATGGAGVAEKQP